MKRNRIARIWASAAILSVVLVGTAACSVDGAWQLPDRDRIPTLTVPTLTLPTGLPVPPTDPGGNEPEPPAAEPDEPPVAEPDAPPVAEPDVAPDPETPVDAPVAEDRRLPWWPVLIVLAVGVIVVIIVRARGGASRAWEEQFGAASAGVAWTESSLVPQVLAATTATDAAAIWTAARPRVLELDEQLHTLATDAGGDLNRGRATELRESFAALVAAIDAETTTTAKTTADRLRALRIDVDNARARVRAALLTTSSSQ